VVVSNAEELRAACAPALADVERSRPGLLRLGSAPDMRPGMNPWGNPIDGLWLWGADGRAGTGIWLGEPGETPVDAAFRVTEVVQEAAIHAVHGAWPDCPDHPDGHPLEVATADDVAVWLCRVSARVVARVGELPA
jgi:hypothetical protein